MRRALCCLAAWLLIGGCSTLHYPVNQADWTLYPGALHTGHCKEYAEAVTDNLKRHGVEAYMIGYDWVTMHGNKRKTGAHAVVLFKNEKGLWFIVDNESVHPYMVTPGTRLEMIRQFDIHVVSVRP